MIENFDAEQCTGFSKPRGDGSVFVTGNCGFGRVIVGHHNRDGSGQHGSLKYFSRGHRGLIGGTDGYDRVGGHLVLAVEVQSDKVLTAVVRQDGSNEVCGIGGTVDLEHRMIAVKVVHSGFANERVLNHGLSDAGTPGVTGGAVALGGFCGCWILGFSAVHGPR